jgi:hypothetical protein
MVCEGCASPPPVASHQAHSTLCGELTKLEVDLHPRKLIVLPIAKSEAPETTAVSPQALSVILPPEIKAK